jgi:tetraprenyl-beta-curcumene synthase
MPHSPPRAILRRFISTIPTVKKELHKWANRARHLPDPLRSQALLSIELKAFHCVGGSVYAHYPGVDVEAMIRLIVAFQTISDYLDNLCDRLHVADPDAFRLLHTSIVHALTPGATIHDYYKLYPYSEDTYLSRLVQTCQDLLSRIPNYKRSQPLALCLAENYCELQVLKHIAQGEELLREWVERTADSELSWNEWAAACGSTLGIFLLFSLAYSSSDTEEEQILQAYFPWIQGLHILLDYLIDLSEDKEAGDLNFITFYPTMQARDQSLCKFAQVSKDLARGLPVPAFHRTVVDGLIALYGSDPKVRSQNQEDIIHRMAGDRRNLFWLDLCKGLRRLRVV